MTRTLRPYQRDAVLFGLTHPRFNLFGGMGVGKTSIALHVVSALAAMGELRRPALVLAPAYVAEHTWSAELTRWADLAGVSVSPVVGDAKQRAAALKRDALVYTLGYDNIQWLGEQYPGASWPFQMGIADESTRLKGFRLRQGSKRAQVLGQHAHRHMSHWINLTGTPAENGLVDLWGQQWFVDGGARLGRSFSAFSDRWFKSKQAAADPRSIKLVTLPYAQEQIQDALRDCTVVIDPADHFDLDRPISNTVWVDLPSKARAVYRQLERELAATVDGYDVDAANAKTIKCMQVANGILYHGVEEDPTEWVDLHDAKLAALESVVAEANGMPVLCAINFRADRARVLARFKSQAADLSTTAGMAAFKAGRVALGVAHPDSLGYGVDGLQHVTNIICFYASNWRMGARLQMIERVGSVRQAQAGYKRPVFIHDIVSRGTVDEDIQLRHATKREVLDVLREGLKRRA